MTTPTAAPPSEDRPPRSPYAARWWIVSAAVVGIIALLGLFLAVVAVFHPGGAGKPGRGTPATAPLVTSACGLTGSGPQVPPVVTPRTTWRLVGTMAAPTDPATGPGTTTEGVPACYAPTPLGALYAAANFLAATSTPATRVAAATRLCAPGPGRDAALADLTSGDVGSQASGVQVAGFYFVGYTPAVSAAVNLAVTTGHGGWAQVPLSLVWADGTWLVQLPVTGSPFAAATALPTLGGFTAWAGA